MDLKETSTKVEILAVVLGEGLDFAKEVAERVNENPLSDYEVPEEGPLDAIIEGLKIIPKSILFDEVSRALDFDDDESEDEDEEDEDDEQDGEKATTSKKAKRKK